MRRFEDGGVDSYTANRYRGQHGQISFITGNGANEEFKSSSPDPSPAPLPSTSLAPVQDFQRRGRSRSPPRRSTDVIDVDTSSYKPTIAPYMQQPPPPSRYYQLSAPTPAPVPSSGPSAESMVALLYELRGQLSSEQEARKLLYAQLTELRQSTHSQVSDLRSSLSHVADDIKGGEGRLLALSGRVKEVEVAASVEGRLQEKADRVDERALLAQHAALTSHVADLRAQLDDSTQRHRDDLDLLHREHTRALQAVRDQTADLRQGLEERVAQQAEVFAQRLQVAMERAEVGGGVTREEVAAMAARMAALQGECSAMEGSLRDLRDAGRREGDDATSRGDWVRQLLTEQMQAQARAAQDKLDGVEEGRRALQQTQQRELAALREDTDRRLRDLQAAQAQAADREREAREETEGRMQAALKVATSGLSSLIKETVASLSPAEGGGDTAAAAPLTSTVASLSESSVELEAVLRAEIKTRMKAANKTKARLDLLHSQVEGLKAMVGEEGGDLRKVREELREEARKVERMRERLKELKTKGDEALDREHRSVADVEKRLQAVEELRRKADAAVDDLRRKLDGIAEVERRVQAMEDVRRQADGSAEEVRRKVGAIDDVRRRVDALESDARQPQRTTAAVDDLRRDVEELRQGKVAAVEQLASAVQALQLKQAEWVREGAEQGRAAAAQGEALARVLKEEMAAVRAKMDAVERATDERVRAVDAAQREMRRDSQLALASLHPPHDDEVKREVDGLRREVDGLRHEVREVGEGLRREVREKVDGLSERVDRVRDDAGKGAREAQDRTDHGGLKEVAAALQQLKEEVREVDRHGKTRVDTLASEVAELRGDRRSDEAGRVEEEELMTNALEARGALDDMVAALEARQAEEALEALRQHVNAQMRAVDDRLEACERSVAATAGRTSLTHPLPPTTVDPRVGEEVQAVKAAVTALQRSAQEAQKADAGWREQLRMDALREAREGAVALKEGLVVATSRLEVLEESAAIKSDYHEEMSARILQQLTGVEVRQARMEREWASLQSQHAPPEANSWPPSARGRGDADDADPLPLPPPRTPAPVVAAAPELSARVEVLSDRLNDLAVKHAELALQLSTAAVTAAPPTPGEVATTPAGRRSTMLGSHRASIGPEVAAQIGYLQQAVTSQVGELAYTVQQHQKALDALRLQLQTTQAAGERRLTASKRGVGEAAEKGSILPVSSTPRRPSLDTDAATKATTDVADLSARLAAAEVERERAREALEQRMEATSLEQGRLAQALELLKDRVSALHGQRVSAPAAGRLSDSEGVLLASVASRAATAQVGGVGGESRRQSMVAALASQASQMDHWQQRTTAEMAELSWRIQQLATQVQAQAAPPTAAHLAETAGEERAGSTPTPSAAAAWQSAVDHLEQATSAQIGEVSWLLNELASRVSHLGTVAAPVSAVAVMEGAAVEVVGGLAQVGEGEGEEGEGVVAEEVAELRSELDHLRHATSNQVGELAWKVSALHEQFDSIKARDPAPRPSHADIPAPSTTQPSAEAAAAQQVMDAPAAGRESRGEGAEAGGLASRVDHLEQAMTAQIGELSFRFHAQQDAREARVAEQLRDIVAAQAHVEEAVQRLKERLASLPIAAPPTQPASLAVDAAPVPAPAAQDGEAMAGMESRVQDLQQQLTAQVGELSWRINDIAAALRHLPASSTGPSPPPVDSSQAVDELRAEFAGGLEAAVSHLSGRIDGIASHLSSSPSPAAPTFPPLHTALTDTLAATDERLAAVVAHVQRLEGARAAERAADAAELQSSVASIVAHIETLVHQSQGDASTLRLSVADLRAALDAQHSHLLALDQAIGEELRALCDAQARGDANATQAREALQGRVRGLEGALGRLHARLELSPDGPRPVEGSPASSARAGEGGGQWEPLQSFRGQRERTASEPAPAGDDGRSATAMASLKLGAEGEGGEVGSEEPRHHSHVSIDQSVADATAGHRSAPSVDDMYDPLTPAAGSGPSGVGDGQAVAAKPAPLSIDPASGPAGVQEGKAQPQSPLAPQLSTRSLTRNQAQQPPPQHRQVGSDLVGQAMKRSSRAPAAEAGGVGEGAEVKQGAQSARARMVDWAGGAQPAVTAEAPKGVEGLAVTGSGVGGAAGLGMPALDWKKVGHQKGSLSHGMGSMALKGRVSPPKFMSARHAPSPYDRRLS